jgi:hypothetical protein
MGQIVSKGNCGLTSAQLQAFLQVSKDSEPRVVGAALFMLGQELNF